MTEDTIRIKTVTRTFYVGADFQEYESEVDAIRSLRAEALRKALHASASFEDGMTLEEFAMGLVKDRGVLGPLYAAYGEPK